MSQRATLKKWLKTNDLYFQSNPEMLKTMLNDPAFLVRFNHMLSTKKGRIQRKISKIENRRGVVENVSRKKRTLPSLKLPSISEMSEKLDQVNQMVSIFRDLTGK